MIVDVTNPPGGLPAAVGNGVCDDWNALQMQIDALLGTYYFPPGRYAISQTLVFPYRRGFHIIGSGLAPMVPNCDPLQGSEAAIMWRGDAGGTMIQIEGSGLEWEGLSLWGSNPGSECTSSSSCTSASFSDGRADIGIRIIRTGDGTGTGKMWFSSLLIEDCETGIETAGTLSTDTTAFGLYWCQRCGSAFKLNNDQSVVFSFNLVHSVEVDTVFKIQKGGDLFTQAVWIETEGGTVLDVTDSRVNGAFFQINGVSIAEHVDNISLLNNVSAMSLQQVFRFTNANFGCPATLCSSSSSGTEAGCKNVSVTINRSTATGSNANSYLEISGSRGLAALNGNVKLEGTTSADPIRFFVRDCEVASAGQLIDMANSDHYSYNGLDNWTFQEGLEPNDSGSG